MFKKKTTNSKNSQKNKSVKDYPLQPLGEKPCSPLKSFMNGYDSLTSDKKRRKTCS